MVVEKGISITDKEINDIIIVIMDTERKVKELDTDKSKNEIDICWLEEKIRNLDGKMGCPGCGHVYEKRKDLMFCQRCGASMNRD